MAWYRGKEWLDNIIPSQWVDWIWTLTKFIEWYVWDSGKYTDIYYDMYKNVDGVSERELTRLEVADAVRKELLASNDFSILSFNANMYTNMQTVANIDWRVSWMKNLWWYNYMRNLINKSWVPDRVAKRLYKDMVEWESLFSSNMLKRFLGKVRGVTYALKLNRLSPQASMMALQDWVTNWVRAYSTTLGWSKSKQRLISWLYKRINDSEAFWKRFDGLFALDSDASISQKNILMESSRSDVIDRFWWWLSKKSVELETRVADAETRWMTAAESIKYTLLKPVSWLSVQQLSALESPLSMSPKVLDFMGANTLMYQKVFDESWISPEYFDFLIDGIEALHKEMWTIVARFDEVSKKLWELRAKWIYDSDEYKALNQEFVELGVKKDIAEKSYKNATDNMYNKLNWVKEEAELDYQRLYSMGIFNGSNRNGFSRLTRINFFSSWGSKTMWEFLYYWLLKPIGNFFEMWSRYWYWAAAKNMLYELPNNYHLISLFQWAGTYMRMMNRLWKDSEFKEYVPEKKIEYLMWLFKMTPLYQWMLSFVGSRALIYWIDDYNNAKDFWLNDWQAVGKWIGTALFHILGNVMKDLKTTMIKPSSQLLNMFSENKDMSANDWVQFILDYVNDNVTSYTRFALMDSYKWVTFRRVDESAGYSFLDMLLWTATQYRWDVDKLISDSFLALQQAKDPEWSLVDYMWLDRTLWNISGWSAYLTTKVKYNRIDDKLKDDKEFDKVLKWEIDPNLLSNEILDYMSKKLAKHSWMSSFDTDKKITSDEQWKIAFILNELKQDWVDTEKLMLVMKYGNLKDREREQAWLEAVGATSMAITSLYAYAWKVLMSEERKRFKKVYWETMPEEAQAEIKRTYMKNVLPNVIDADKQMHINLADAYIRETYWGTVAGVKSIEKWGADTEAMRIYKIWLLSEIVDMDKIWFDKNNVKTVFGNLFEKASPEKKWELLIDAFDTIDKVPNVSQNWKVATKAAMMYANIRDLKSLLNGKHWKEFEKPVSDLVEMIIDVDNATTINPALLDNLAGLSWRSKQAKSNKWLIDYKKSKTGFKATNFPEIVKTWLKSLRWDIKANPKLKAIATKYLRKKLTSGWVKKLSLDDFRKTLNYNKLANAWTRGTTRTADKLESKVAWSAKRAKWVSTKRARKIKQPKVKF